VKPFILAALLLGAVPAAAQTNAPDVPPPGAQNQFLRQQQIEALRRDRQMNDVRQAEEIARLQERLDTLNGESDNPDLNNLQLQLDSFLNDQELLRQRAERQILQIAQVSDTARRRRWAAHFTGQQQIERLRQGQRLSGIAADLSRFRGQ
jgi:hypothetical protein